MANGVGHRKAEAAGGKAFHGFVMHEVITTRFAPSPTGYLHLGHAFAAWTAWRRARATGGRFFLRIEDIDPARCRPAYAAALEDDLRWLGLDWDGDVMVQSARLAIYRAALQGLAARGLAYPCFCSRAEVAREVARSGHAPHGPDGETVYPGTCRGLATAACAQHLAKGAPHAWRLDMAAALAGAPALFFEDEAAGRVRAAPAAFGDVVLGRRDVPASYHLCCVLDDAAQGVNLVTRAADLRAATHLHRLLQHVLGLAAPRYAFFPAVTGTDGQRLSKRDGAASLRGMRAAGMTAEQILRPWSAGVA